MARGALLLGLHTWFERLNEPLFVLVVSAVRVLASDPLLLWQAAVHHLEGRHLLQLPEQVSAPAEPPDVGAGVRVHHYSNYRLCAKQANAGFQAELQLRSSPWC